MCFNEAKKFLLLKKHPNTLKSHLRHVEAIQIENEFWISVNNLEREKVQNAPAEL